jgi:HEAT repeat protein
VSALGVLKGNAEAEKLATAALKDEKGDRRAAAATALGAMHAVGAKAPLEAALDDNEPAVVLAAANSLSLLKDTPFRLRLLRRLDRNNAYQQRRA